MNSIRIVSLLITTISLFAPTYSFAQITNENGSIMAWVHNYITNDIPLENSEGYVKADSADLSRFKNIFDLVLAENYSQANDSLETFFPSYEMVALTDTAYSDQLFYVIRETTVTKGWGVFVYNPSYQRDVMVAVPHPIFDSNTPYEGVDMLQFLGARFFTMAGTHRCAAAETVSCSGTTTACTDGDAENFKISDMAHNDSTVFQRAHQSLLELSPNAYFLNIHGHNRETCEDVFVSNGREDDTQPILQALRDSLLAHNIDVAVPGDITDCTLFGSTNTQGRLVNGSSNPCSVANLTNSGRFFHIEQSVNSRKSQSAWMVLIEELSDMIPRTFNTVTLPSFESLTINEIHFFPIAPNGDANGNGSVQTVSDEFVEIVNSGNSVFDLSGWAIADNTQNRHVFSTESKLAPGAAIVVFGGSFSGNFDGSLVQSSSTGALSLNNNNETVFLVNALGAPIFSVSYDTTDTNFQGGSLVRNPDVSGNFEYHSSADTQDNSWFSPGKKINNSAFVPFAEITNVAGWRMLSAPSTSYSLRNLEAFTAIQGIDDGNPGNLYTNYNGTIWEKPNSLDENLSAGNGFIIYFYNNNLFGSTELPITLRSNDLVPNADVEIDLHSSGNKFNLIGNPFDSPIDFSLISANNGALGSVVGHIWDPNVGAHTTTFAWNDEVGAWQGIMLENDTAESLTIPLSSKIGSGNFANGDVLKRNSERSVYRLSFKSSTSTKNTFYDQLFYVIDPIIEGREEMYRAKKLSPLNSNDKVFTWKLDNSDASYLQLSEATINPKKEIFIEEFGSWSGEMMIKLELLFGPKLNLDWSFYDFSTKQSFQLSGLDSINVQAISFAAFKSGMAHHPIVMKSQNEERFKVTISSRNATNTNHELPFEFSLDQNFPNPFNPVTQISFTLSSSQQIRLEVLSLLGEVVSVLEDGTKGMGRHTIQFDASTLSSGIYIYRLTSDQGVISKKMILLK